jgi:hypothetical protein
MVSWADNDPVISIDPNSSDATAERSSGGRG